MTEPTRIHPALLERLAELAGDAALLEAAFLQVRPEGPHDLPDLVADIIARRRATMDAPPRRIPISTDAPPDWLLRFAGAGDEEERRAARSAWPASERRSPLEMEPNPVMRFYLALALRAGHAFGLPHRRWPGFIHGARVVLLAAVVWLVLTSTHGALALLVLAVAGAWMLLGTPHVQERLLAGAAVADFNSALDRALERDAETGRGDGTLEPEGPGA